MVRRRTASLGKLSVRGRARWTPNARGRPDFGGAGGDPGAFAGGAGGTRV